MVFSPKNCLVDIILGYDINKLYSSHPVIEILVKVYIVLIFKVILLGIKVFFGGFMWIADDIFHKLNRIGSCTLIICG